MQFMLLRGPWAAWRNANGRSEWANGWVQGRSSNYGSDVAGLKG